MRADWTMTADRRGWVVLTLLKWAMLGLGAAWIVSVAAVVMWGARDQAQPSDAIVVLGAAQYAGRPSPVLKARLDHAVELYRKRQAPWLVLTGGRGTGDTTSEAAVGRRYAVREGVPERAILLEAEGRTTTASLEAAAEIMKERGLRRAILVSDPFHMLRLKILARRFDMEVLTSPTRSSPISASRSESFTYVLGESIKVPATIALALLAR